MHSALRTSRRYLDLVSPPFSLHISLFRSGSFSFSPELHSFNRTFVFEYLYLLCTLYFFSLCTRAAHSYDARCFPPSTLDLTSVHPSHHLRRSARSSSPKPSTTSMTSSPLCDNVDCLIPPIQSCPRATFRPGHPRRELGVCAREIPPEPVAFRE